ncbi:MAG TPA: FAD/NAD(P)-binding protein, partial [Actinomycetota bacterium]|nr:FAD/NAD(P)-binding protein [Actinomycetota bacterium]
MGLGPKGLYCLERLLAHYYAAPTSRRLHVDVFNRTGLFGASPIYDPELPDYLIVNIKVGEIDIWDSRDPPPVVGDGQSFVAWCSSSSASRQSITGEEYLPRALVGQYLVDAFRLLLSKLPSGVTVACHVGEVVDIEPSGAGYSVIVVSKGRAQRTAADTIMLATGHSRTRQDGRQRRWSGFSARHPSCAFVPFVYPVEARMAPIPPGSTVACCGLGLTFIDALLELTEGRGGRFLRLDGRSLVYRPSGREPGRILPFSRSGLPMLPKPDDIPTTQHRLRFATAERFERLRRASPGGTLELEGEVWSLCELEMEAGYYRVLMRDKGSLRCLEAAGGDPQAAWDAIDGYLSEHPDDRLDWEEVLDPVSGWKAGNGPDFDRCINSYLRREIARAHEGEAGSPIKAALAVWYEVRGALGTLLRKGAFTPRAHRTLLREVLPRFKRVAFGPPAGNLEKLLALNDAGIVDFSVARNPAVTLDETAGLYLLSSSRFPGRARAEILVDARYPQVDLANDASPLVRNLLSRG